MPQGIKRTSNLQAPIMQLSGHGAEVYSLNFSPDGQTIASSSFDKMIYLWRTYGECENFMIMGVSYIYSMCTAYAAEVDVCVCVHACALHCHACLHACVHACMQCRRIPTMLSLEGISEQAHGCRRGATCRPIYLHTTIILHGTATPKALSLACRGIRAQRVVADAGRVNTARELNGALNMAQGCICH